MISFVLYCLTLQQASADCTTTDSASCEAETGCGWWSEEGCYKCSDWDQSNCQNVCGWYNLACTKCTSIPNTSCLSTGCGLSFSNQCINCGGLSTSTCSNYFGCYLSGGACYASLFRTQTDCVSPYEWVDSKCQIQACSSSKKSNCICGTSSLVVCGSSEGCKDIAASTGVCKQYCAQNLNSNSCQCGTDQVECLSSLHTVWTSMLQASNFQLLFIWYRNIIFINFEQNKFFSVWNSKKWKIISIRVNT